MKEQILKRIEQVKLERNGMQVRINEIKKEEQELISKFLVSNGALEELQNLLKESEVV